MSILLMSTPSMPKEACKKILEYFVKKKRNVSVEIEKITFDFTLTGMEKSARITELEKKEAEYLRFITDLKYLQTIV